MKVYDVPPAARELMVKLAVIAAGALVLAGSVVGLIQIVLGGPGAGGPVSAAAGLLFSVIAVLAGLLLAGVLVTYLALRLGGARRHHAAAADVVERFNTGHDGRRPEA